MCQTVTHPEWCNLHGAVIPVNGISDKTEPLIIRKGQKLTTASRVQTTTEVNFLAPSGEWTQADPRMDEAEEADRACQHGSTSSRMSKEEDHPEGDWRRGKTLKQRLQETREGDRAEEYTKWKEKWHDKINLGPEDGTKWPKLQEEIRD